jgi:hypothetical protein
VQVQRLLNVGDCRFLCALNLHEIAQLGQVNGLFNHDLHLQQVDQLSASFDLLFQVLARLLAASVCRLKDFAKRLDIDKVLLHRI